MSAIERSMTVTFAQVVLACILPAFGLALSLFILIHIAAYVQKRIAMRAMHRIPGPPSESLLCGNIHQYYAPESEEFHRKVALDYGPVVRLTGFLSEPILYVSDPKALQAMLIKDEHIFQETDEFLAQAGFTFGDALLAATGAHHNKHRKILNPMFSMKHMRNLTPLFYEIAHNLAESLKLQIQGGGVEVNILSWTSRASLEGVERGCFGYSMDPLIAGSKDAYADTLKLLFRTLDDAEHLLWLVPYMRRMLPNWMLRMVVDMFPVTSKVGRARDLIAVMHDRAEDIYLAKKRALKSGGSDELRGTGVAQDLISALIHATTSASEAGQKLSTEEVISIMSIFILAGTETTSGALSRILTLLAEHPDYQVKLRAELLEAGAAQGLSHDDLNRLPLLDSVIRETLRLYPPFMKLVRVAREDAILPLSEPVSTTDGKRITTINVPKGSHCLIGISGSNWNESMWGDDSLQWRPDRWLPAPPTSSGEATVPGVYSNLMTFSGGKRSCVGFKFSEIEMKVVLSVLVSMFTFESSDKPIKWNMGTVCLPTVEGHYTPELPIKIQLYKGIDP